MKKTAVYLVFTLLIASTLPLSAHADPSNDIPTNAQATGIHNSLVAALIHADLVTTLSQPGPFTVFAPTDQAFIDAGINLNDFDTIEENETLADILLYHVVPAEVSSMGVQDCMTAEAANGQQLSFTLGDTVMVNGANVTTADLVSSNGIIHAIDKVLMPTDSPRDIPTTAHCTGVHSSLVAGVVQAELLETLQGPGPFTVFAPTDQAFADAGIDLAALDTPEGKATLSDILLYHVVSGEVPAANVSECMSAVAANGQPLAFTVDGGVMVNDANVTTPDVVTSNGIIHVIDKVLTPSDAPNDIPRTAQCTTVHDSLVAAVVQAELLETLQGPGPFTLFAPTDQAFIDAGIDLASFNTPEGKQTLSDILLYHVISGNVPSSAVTECMNADAANGQPLSFTVDGGVMVNGATVTIPDVATSNGVIHVIDKVLMPTDTPNDIPRTAQCTGEHNSLVSSVIQAELLETLQGDGPFTVFAPTDQAFTDAGIDLAALDTPEGKTALSEILLYHVLEGEVPASNVTDCLSATTVNGNPLSFTVGDSVMVNGANVTATDVPTSNGIIHVIDKVLQPTATPNDIPRTAQCTGSHDSLVAAVIQAELLETLQGDGPFTVFAPTDQAFTDAGIDLASLDNPEGKEALSNILLYHVVSGEVPSSAVTECMNADAVNGQPLSFTVNGGVMVNGANVTLPDVGTSNGIIHVIDKVLMPTDTPNDIPRTAQCTGSHDSLVAAVIQAELLETLQGPGPFTVFAPTDLAFADAGIDLAALDTPDGKTALTDILLYHVVSGEVPSSAVEECGTAIAINGNMLSFGVGDSVTVNGATVTLPDVATSNGVIHVIDKVLMPTDTPNDIPRTAQCTGIHDSLVAAVIEAELLETLQGEGPFTIFAPTDQAFLDAGIDLSSVEKAELRDLLLYHVVSGEVASTDLSDCMTATAFNGQPLAFTVGDSVLVNDATVTSPDVATSNGIIHVIDSVLSPSDAPNDATRTAVCTGEHTSLVAALIQAELDATLQEDGPFTIFAPTDEAFTNAGIDLAVLDTPEGKEQLSNILLYHVHAGTILSTDIEEGMTLQMVNGKNATLSLLTGIDGANITSADILTSNGVIHVIDKVIIPQAEVDPTVTGDGVEADEEEDNLVMILIIVGVVLAVAALGGLLFVRGRRPSSEIGSKEFTQDGLSSVAQPDPTYTYEAQQPTQQTYASQYAPQQSSPLQPVQVEQIQPAQTQVAQPVAQVQTTQPVIEAQPVQAVQQTQASQAAVQLPEVLQQWTDESGHSWRRMSDGGTMWWNGTDWQKYA